eukprot:CAMPEP_0181385798 /NCGR_PEP_ID=MMETSP1106-20121128/22767_1 /TAXON_ID=81844 /ORGANISM="Mantoniella antarctica, Strain SL-175" /LENGTH=59 /DNA_ID=CAMNT_0023505913 /DNA_START=54 /DNA_END=230 /DNA_ORIENTATION=+
MSPWSSSSPCVTSSDVMARRRSHLSRRRRSLRAHINPTPRSMPTVSNAHAIATAAATDS